MLPGQMRSNCQMTCSLSSLFIALLFTAASSASLQSDEDDRLLSLDRDTGIGHDSIVDIGDNGQILTVSVISTKVVASTTATSLDHLYHRHGASSDILKGRALSTNSSSTQQTTTTNPGALSCYKTYSKWRQASMSWYNTAIYGKSWSTTTTPTTLIQTVPTVATVYPSGSLSTYKLCDGSPRVDFEPLTLTSDYVSTTGYDEYVTIGTPTYSPKPCTASAEDCEYLYYDSGLSWDDLTLMGLCGSPAHLGLPCLIAGGPVELAYFPVTTAGDNKCHANGSTITNTGGPTTVETLGTTFTSGSVYLSFKSLYAYQEGFGNKIGPRFTNFILPLPSSAISTQCGGWFSARGAGTPLNYADLNFPWPASAYNCMNRCSTDKTWTMHNGTNIRYTPPHQCSTIWSDFNPILAMPTEVRHLVPAWSTCSMWDAALPNFVFDPPRALVEGTAVATPTPSFKLPATTTPAAPAETSYTALAETISTTSTASTSKTTLLSSSESSSDPTTSATTTTTSTSSQTPDTNTKGTGSTGINIEFSIDGHTFTASAGDNAFSILGQTISVGGPARVIDSETISLALSGFVVNATTTIPFHSRTTRTSSSDGTEVSMQDAPTAAKGTKKSGGSMFVVSWAGIVVASLLAVVVF